MHVSFPGIVRIVERLKTDPILTVSCELPWKSGFPSHSGHVKEEAEVSTISQEMRDGNRQIERVLAISNNIKTKRSRFHREMMWALQEYPDQRLTHLLDQ